MPRRPTITARKRPRQQRSAALVDTILEAAIRVLADEGPSRFTTVRVAKVAGVSVGSLYQYFPNKAALLFRMQTDEWDETWSALEEILADARTPAHARFRRMVRAFFRSERLEASLREALDDAATDFRRSPEAARHAAKVREGLHRFFAELGRPSAFAFDFAATTLSAVGERVTSEPHTLAETDAIADATADMIAGWLAQR